MKKSIGLIFFVLLICLFVPDAEAKKKPKPDPVIGRWVVTTKLVAAMDQTNPSYHIGDKRVEVWTVAAGGPGTVLASHAGVIGGRKVGKAWVYDQWYDTGYGIAIHQHLVARTTSSTKMKGTIETRYYNSQFGYQVGIDAWSFTAKKKKK